jgi:hypothetical protein
MRLLVGINGSAFEPGVNLVAQLATSELDALGRAIIYLTPPGERVNDGGAR